MLSAGDSPTSHLCNYLQKRVDALKKSQPSRNISQAIANLHYICFKPTNTEAVTSYALICSSIPLVC